ncbi:MULTISPECIES: glycosyltransferase family 4 protein [unclassified Fusibacter]|uniref:glycosyltransferase family 4 protein n=1 Tax=unclassified Fusibacter TaxID=2624464 RepID=UPI001013684C|nr:MULTISPECIES: glycosyltransferase family 4 protein [unclassified Fusibacter]MCK8060558.1 glycosyltransferase family 4 protein [Fusibacter sp. A2]NPE22988.1 glycosyltransferase family 4 protein [Fusibacter sp. A1]RXV60053.1 glycosyltransferase family 1 protein [Fusibacter sp. A1]
MKIIHIVNGNDVGGATTQVSALIKAQKELHTVEVIAFGTGKIVELCGLLSVPVSVYPLTPLAAMRLIREIRTSSRGGAVIHAHGLKAMFFSALASVFHGKLSTVATIHSDYYHEYSGNTLKRMIAIPVIKWSIRRIRRFITVSDRFIEVIYADGIGTDRCTYIPNGIDLSLVKPEKSRETFLNEYDIDTNHTICGIAARIHPVKGIDMLIDIAAKFKGQPVQFVIAGIGHPEYVNTLKERVRNYGMEEQVHFIGFVDTIYDFYQAIDINLLSSYSEGVSYSVMEGGALGRPVVCTAVSGMKTLIEDEVDGLMVPIGDKDAFAMRLKRLVEDINLRERLGQALKSKVNRQFSNKVMALAYDEVYRQLLRGQHGN